MATSAVSSSAPPPLLPVALVCLFLATSAVSSAATGSFSYSSASGDGSGSEMSLGWVAAQSGCRGSVGECLGGEEFELGGVSEATRRLLLSRSDYISYGALKRNRVPCSRRGASYYNCRPGAQRNPYSRGCSAITQCRR